MSDKAIIYVRVSTEDQTEQSQIEPCETFCKEHNYEVVGIYRDHSKSAYKNVKRQGYDKVMELVRNRQINHIVVWALDRWSRKGYDELKSTIVYLSAYEVQLHSVKEQWIESINIPGIGPVVRDFMIGMTGWMAQQESERISSRVIASEKYQKALTKGTVGRPEIPQEVKKEIKRLLGEGRSYSYIEEHVTYKVKHGAIKHVSAMTINKVKKALLNPDTKMSV
jgi:putative DNA-invertase from lambdoid prophage Rac